MFAGNIMPRYPREKECLFWGFSEAFSKGMSDINIGKHIDTISQFAMVKKSCLFGLSPPNNSPLPFLPLLYAGLEDVMTHPNSQIKM
jgi:hypothetical protein